MKKQGVDTGSGYRYPVASLAAAPHTQRSSSGSASPWPRESRHQAAGNKKELRQVALSASKHFFVHSAEGKRHRQHTGVKMILSRRIVRSG
ncbi:hypothetical protein BS78_06G055800 [Paspalum vaginatum]|nr:hypothetical protein BS78_06G055800 [Paspalum vaginatum]KAJ1270492.1 hypothetical protein BS78_06G055800 [Paspalum vaginatum]